MTDSHDPATLSRPAAPGDDQIVLRRERDFGVVISDSVALVSAHAGRFFPALLGVIVLPILITGYAEAMAEQGGDFADLWSSLGSIASSVMSLFLVGCTYVYAFLFEERRVEDMTTRTLRRGASSMFWPIVGVNLLGAVGFVAAAFVLLLPAILLQSTALGVITGVVVVAGLVFGLPIYSIAVPVRVMEVHSAADALRRAYRLVTPHWGQTFGVLLVTNLVTMLLAVTPYFVLGWLAGLGTGGEVDSPLFILAVVVASFGSVLFVVPAMAGLLQYFDLVARADEPRVLEERVEQIGEEREEEPLF